MSQIPRDFLDKYGYECKALHMRLTPQACYAVSHRSEPPRPCTFCKNPLYIEHPNAPEPKPVPMPPEEKKKVQLPAPDLFDLVVPEPETKPIPSPAPVQDPPAPSQDTDTVDESNAHEDAPAVASPELEAIRPVNIVRKLHKRKYKVSELASLIAVRDGDIRNAIEKFKKNSPTFPGSKIYRVMSFFRDNGITPADVEGTPYRKYANWFDKNPEIPPQEGQPVDVTELPFFDLYDVPLEVLISEVKKRTNSSRVIIE